jgi:hypothetical protein
MSLDKLLDSVKSSILDHVQQQKHTGFDAGGLLEKITNMFGDHKQTYGNHSVAPASQDPYGDPGATGPAAKRPTNVKPASEDPYGDPADQEKRGR